jgi:zinc protease
MPWSRLLALALLFISAPLAPLTAQTAPTGPRSGHWAHEGSPLKPDERVVWGRLENGVRYALLPHHGVPGRVTLRFIVLSGSIDEQPNEWGLAHFMEHMAFRGTRHFAPSEMVSLFQRLGTEYGSDVNAVTTYDNTSFMLEFREDNPDLIREGLRLFRDIGDGPLFEPEAIDRERRVILAEMRSRDGLAERKMQASFPIVFHGLQFAQHSPIGTEKHILSFQRDDFVKFHERCYRPDLMVMVAVGDFAPGAMETAIRDAFGDMPKARTPLPPRNEGHLDVHGLRAGIYRISGVGAAETLAASVIPPTHRPETREMVIERQRRGFVMDLFSERLRNRVPSVDGAEATYESVVGYEAAMASVRVPGTEWKHGILAVDETIRNTYRNNFDRDEVEAVRLRQLRYARHLAEQAPTLDPRVLCDSLADSITDHHVFLGLGRENLLMAEWLEKLSPADVQQTFRALWNIDNMAFHVGGDVDDELDPAKIVQQVQQYRKGKLTYLPPPLAREDLPNLKPRGEPTKVEERREVAELGAVLMRFGNNVRLNFVSNRQEPGLARAVIRIGSGILDMPGRRAALKEFALDTMLASGTGRYRPEQLSRVIEDRLLSFSFDVSDPDAFTFRSEMGVDNLETFLRVASEYLTDPQFTQDAHSSARMRAVMDGSSAGIPEAMREMTNRLFDGDPRFTWGAPLDYVALSVVDVRHWMAPALTHGYVEVTIIGDLTEEAAISAVSRTLGALGPRAGAKQFDTIAPARVTAPAGYMRIEFLGEHHLGLAVGTWPIEGPLKLRDTAALNVLAKILEIRVRNEVRETLGLSYGPSAELQNYDGYGGLLLLQATADCAPKDVERAANAMTEVGARMAKEGVTEGEFAGSCGILKSQLRRAFLDNGFLIETLMRAQERPETLEKALELHRGTLAGVTRDEVNAWATKVLPADNSRTAGLVPKAFIGVFESAPP